MLDQIEVLDRTHARAEPPPHLDVPHMGPITPDLAPRLRAVARVPGASRHRPNRKLVAAHRPPCRYNEPALGSFETSEPTKPSATPSEPQQLLSIRRYTKDQRDTRVLVFRDGCTRNVALYWTPKDRVVGLHLGRAL